MRSIKLLLLLLLAVKFAYGQANPPTTPIYEQNITPPSPAVAALDRYIDCPVSYSTGVPDISIPLYILKSTKLSAPISLSYHAGGIKVSDRSVTMGLGWSLNAGGSISRVIQDVPDEESAPGGFVGFLNMTYPDENQPDGYLKDICLGNEIYNVYLDSGAKYDGQPDQFFYNFNGHGGKFLFRNRTATGVAPQAVTIPYSPIKITYSGEYFTEFNIIDEEGDTYEFGGSATDSYSNMHNDRSSPISATTAWHLIKIISADKTDSIMFTYTSIAGTNTQQNAPSTTVSCSYGAYNPPSTTQVPGIISTVTTNSDQTLMTIQEITCTNGKVDFSYDSGGKLQGIQIYNNVNGVSSEIKSYALYQSSFGITTDESLGFVYSGVARPRLDSIKETGYVNNVASITNPPYKFSYLTPDVPDIYSKSQDYWGFYNGKTNTDMTMIDVSPTNGYVTPDYQKRAPDPIACLKGMLQSIIYPTGGYTNFTFEPNQIYSAIPGSNVDPQSANYHISTIDMAPNDQVDGVSLTFTANPQIQGQIKLDFTGANMCTPSGSCVVNTPEAKLVDLTQNVVVADISLSTLTQETNPQSSQESVTYYTLTPSDQYKIYFPTPGNITYNGQSTEFRLDAVVTETLPPITTATFDSTTFYAGGVRIKQIQHNDGNNNTITKNYNYTIPYWNSQLYQGDFGTISNWLTRDKLLFQGGNLETEPPTYISSIIYSEGFNIPIGSTDNSSVSYQQVEESMTDNNGNPLGKNVYTYNTSEDYISPQFPMYRFDMSYDRSQLLDTKTYKSTTGGGYALIKEVANTYNNINDLSPLTPGADSIKYYVAYSDFDFQKWISQSGRPTIMDADEVGGLTETYHDAFPVVGCPIYNYMFNHIAPFYYHVVKQLLTSVVTTDYDLTGQNPVASETDYAYDNLQHIQPTRVTTTNSDTKVQVVTNRYPLDYNLQGGCNLQSIVNNFNQQLVSLQSQRATCAQATFTLPDDNYSEHMYMVNSYAVCENNYNAAVATLVTQYNTSLAQYALCYSTTESALPSASKAIAYMQDRNMITPKINVATTVNNAPILGDSTTYQVTDVAQNIIRPQQVNIKVGSNPTEARAQFYAYDAVGNLLEQSKTGDTHTSYQWGYNKTYPVAQAVNAKSNDIFYDSFEEGDGNSSVGDAKTGHYSYNGLTTAYTKTLTGLDNGTYTLCYWQKTAGVWTLQTSTVTVNSGSYTISLNAQIDDVRFYPSTAQMTTYTYDPQIGMTSSTDVKNETTYYEYDGLQRLINIKDKDGNIIKHMAYHYQGQ